MKLSTYPLPGKRQMPLVDGAPLLASAIIRESRSQPGRVKVAFAVQINGKPALVPLSNTPGTVDLRLEMS